MRAGKEFSRSSLVFPYKSHKLLKSSCVAREDMGNIKSASNDGDYYVFCGSCDTYMLYVNRINDNFGFWACPCCGAKVKETTVYNQSQKELERKMARVFSPEVSEKYHELMDAVKRNYEQEKQGKGK